jgi:hypothetical protein
MSQKDLIRKIRALREKAANAASSEAETLAAAEAAAKLIAKHEITESELSEANDEGDVKAAPFEGARKTVCPSLNAAIGGICEFCQVDAYFSFVHRGSTLMIVGLEADRLMAMYLAELIQASAQRAWRALLLQNNVQPKRAPVSARNDFKTAFGLGVGEKLRTLAKERLSQQATTGTDLVVLKSEIIKSAMPTNLADPRPLREIKPNGLTRAGFRSGSDLSVDRPITAKEMQEIGVLK